MQIEEKSLLRETQTGFREGTIDNIQAINLKSANSYISGTKKNIAIYSKTLRGKDGGTSMRYR